MSAFDLILDQIAGLRARMDRERTTLRLGTVQPSGTVLLTDGAEVTPAARLVATETGDIVLTAQHSRRTYILGKPPGSDDTGWVEIVPESGFTAVNDIHVRRVGRMVEVRGTLTRTAGGISDATVDTCLTLPAEYRPAQTLRMPNGMFATSSAYAQSGIYVGTDGAVDFVRIGGSGTTHPSVHLAHSWLVG